MIGQSNSPMFFIDVDPTYNIDGIGNTLVFGLSKTTGSKVLFETNNSIGEGSIADIIGVDINKGSRNS